MLENVFRRVNITQNTRRRWFRNQGGVHEWCHVAIRKGIDDQGCGAWARGFCLSHGKNSWDFLWLMDPAWAWAWAPVKPYGKKILEPEPESPGSRKKYSRLQIPVDAWSFIYHFIVGSERLLLYLNKYKVHNTSLLHGSTFIRKTLG